jgi:integrase
MPSIYTKGKKLYVSWYDSVAGKRINRSTKLSDTDANRKKVEAYVQKLEIKLKNDADSFKRLGIKRISIKEAFDHFLRNNSEKHPKTIKDYHRFYKKFTEYFNENDVATSIDKLSVEAWLLEIKKLPLQKNSIFGYYKQCRHFLNFLFEYNYTQMFLINKDVRPKSEIKEKITFNQKYLQIIFDNLHNKNANFKTLIYLAYYTGLRSSDLLSIKAEDIDIVNRELKYFSPKRKKYRVIGFHRELVPIFSQRLEQIKTGEILEYNNVENLGRAIKRYFTEIGLPNKGYTPRTFRKTFITICRNSEMDASIVAELVGHEHRSTADRFYNNITTNRMLKELEKFESPVKTS